MLGKSLRFTLVASFALLAMFAGSRADASKPRENLSVAGDFDGDGVPDRVTVVHEGLTVRLSHVHGPQYFRVSAADDIVGIAVGDLDRDGDPDLLALQTTGQLIVCRNQGGRLTQVSPRTNRSRLACGQEQLSGPLGADQPPAFADGERGLSSGGLPARAQQLPDVPSARFLLPARLFSRRAFSSRPIAPRAPPLPPIA